MSEERVERRLTAILAADVAGYSRLMGADEEGTLAALKAIRRELVDPWRGLESPMSGGITKTIVLLGAYGALVPSAIIAQPTPLSSIPARVKTRSRLKIVIAGAAWISYVGRNH